MKLIKKQYTAEVKEIDEKKRTLTAYVSTADKDRDGEVIPATAWKIADYRKNPVVLWAHNHRLPPVAKSLWIKQDEKGLRSKMQFADTVFGNEIFYLYKEGFMRAFSVGFMGAREPDDWSTFLKCDLLEYSCVPVPANPAALAERHASGDLKVCEDTFKIVVKGIEDVDVDEKDEETDTHIHVRTRDPKKFLPGSFRIIDISKSKGTQAIVGQLQGEKTTTVQEYMFLKAKDWTMEKAKTWVKEDGKSFADKEEILTFLYEDGQEVKTDTTDQPTDTTVSAELPAGDVVPVAKFQEALQEIGKLKAGREDLVPYVKGAMATLEALMEASRKGPAAAAPEPKLDKRKKGVIIRNKGKETTQPEISAERIRAAVAKAFGSEIRRLQGTIE